MKSKKAKSNDWRKNIQKMYGKTAYKVVFKRNSPLSVSKIPSTKRSKKLDTPPKIEIPKNVIWHSLRHIYPYPERIRVWIKDCMGGAKGTAYYNGYYFVNEKWDRAPKEYSSNEITHWALIQKKEKAKC